MEIIPISDPRFGPYGRAAEGFGLSDFLSVLRDTPMPEAGTCYEPSWPALEELPAAEALRDQGFGGLDIEIGFCNGYNSKLTCLEYHRSSEIDIPADDVILLLALQTELEEYRLDTGRVRAFLVPAGTAVELYATTLHYAPCGVGRGKGFRMACVLPRGTNLASPQVPAVGEARLLLGRNKWVIASPGTPEAEAGAFVGLHGPAVELFA